MSDTKAIRFDTRDFRVTSIHICGFPDGCSALKALGPEVQDDNALRLLGLGWHMLITRCLLKALRASG